MAKPFQNQPKIPHKAPKAEPEPDIFGKKGHVLRGKFIGELKKGSGKIPGSAKSYTWQERKSLAEEITKRYGSHFTRREAQERLRKLRRKKFEAKAGKEKLDIGREIRYLEEKFRGF